VTDAWFERVCQSALGHRTSQEQTYDIARLVLQRGIPGDFVECGVYAGASCALMARAIMDHYSDEWHPALKRRVHLFDSFRGIPAPGPHDHDLRDNRGGESACSMEDVTRNMHDWGIPEELLVYHPGLFSETVPRFSGVSAVRHDRIALLRLDADLYESTRVCIQYLYERLSPGAYVILDDYDLDGTRKAVAEYFAPGAPAPILWRKTK
jgi:O-methyltransferase